jgi:3,4-dihydroxy 2-butanone 4-phosphate synthase/GTP cyclohydrolase II
MSLDSTADLLDAFRRERAVVLVDDEGARSGVLLLPAETITAEQVNFMARQARGLICLALTPQRCDRLALPLMVPGAGDSQRGNFTVSIEAAEGVSTGISAADRALTIRTAVAPAAQARDLVQPGHVFPLRAASGGVLRRAGHAEGACDLARLAGFEPAAAFADILNDDGSLAAGTRLFEFARRHELPIGSIADLIHYRLHNETTVELLRRGDIDTEHGPFTLSVFRDRDDGSVHLALHRGEIRTDQACLVRVQALTTLRDGIGSTAAGRRVSWSLPASLRHIDAADHGVLVLLNYREAEAELLRSVSLAFGEEAPPAPRDNVFTAIGLGAQILRQLGVGRMRLMGKPIRYNALSGFGLEVVECISPDGRSLQEDADHARD